MSDIKIKLTIVFKIAIIRIGLPVLYIRGFFQVDTLKSDKDELEQEVQKLKDKLHQFKKKSVDSEMDIQKTHESITEMEDRTKALEDKLRTSEITCEEWQDKFKESQETIYQNNIQLKKLNAEKSALQTDLDEVRICVKRETTISKNTATDQSWVLASD